MIRALAMSAVLLLFLFMFVTFTSESPQVDQDQHVSFGTLDFGEQRFIDLPIHNDSTAEWQLGKIAPTCSCVTIESCPPRVGPGERAFVRALVINDRPRVERPLQLERRTVGVLGTATSTDGGEIHPLAWRLEGFFRPWPRLDTPVSVVQAGEAGDFIATVNVIVSAASEATTPSVTCTPTLVRGAVLASNPTSINVVTDAGDRTYTISIRGALESLDATGLSQLELEVHGQFATCRLAWSVPIEGPCRLALSPGVLGILDDGGPLRGSLRILYSSRGSTISACVDPPAPCHVDISDQSITLEFPAGTTLCDSYVIVSQTAAGHPIARRIPIVFVSHDMLWGGEAWWDGRERVR